jgi:hypothetical protein
MPRRPAGEPFSAARHSVIRPETSKTNNPTKNTAMYRRLPNSLPSVIRTLKTARDTYKNTPAPEA